MTGEAQWGSDLIAVAQERSQAYLHEHERGRESATVAVAFVSAAVSTSVAAHVYPMRLSLFLLFPFLLTPSRSDRNGKRYKYRTGTVNHREGPQQLKTQDKKNYGLVASCSHSRPAPPRGPFCAKASAPRTRPAGRLSADCCSRRPRCSGRQAGQAVGREIRTITSRARTNSAPEAEHVLATF